MRLRLPLGYIKMGLHYVRVGLWLLRRFRAYIGVSTRLPFRLQLLRLGWESRAAWGRPADRRIRIGASAGWYFPIYSHTFVYQELTQLLAAGFRVAFFYGAINHHDPLARQYRPLWRAKRRLLVHPMMCQVSLRYFQRSEPARLEAVLSLLESASGLSREQLLTHEHVLQAFAFSRLLRAYRPHYLHSYFFYQDTMYMLVASMLLDVPRGVSCYADHMLQDYELKMVGAHLRQCSLAVATSNRIKTELLELEPRTPEARVLVKPNAINAEHFPEVDRRARHAGLPIVLVSVCRLEPKKGLIHLADAVHALRERGVDLRWIAIGGVDASESSRHYAAELQIRIADLKLQDVVRLAGKQGEAAINAAFVEADIFVAPFVETDSGDKDGVPTALLEAMASGLPAVVTDAGSITEVIADRRNGLMVPQRDSAALAEAIALLVRDADLRRDLGLAGTATVRERFAVQVCEGALHERIRALVRDGHG
ncbi:MAG: glycosyltransferase family 4 protein, partial [Acidobacteriota bacterium]